MEDLPPPTTPTSPLVDPFVFAKHFTTAVAVDPSPPASSTLLDSIEGETSEFTRAFRSSGVYPRRTRTIGEDGFYEPSPLALSSSVPEPAAEPSEQEFEPSEPEHDDSTEVSAESTTPENIGVLPDEIIVFVTRFLRLHDVMSLLETSRRFNWLGLNNKDIWLQLYAYYESQLGPLFDDGPDVNVWDDEPIVSPAGNNTIGSPSPDRDRLSFASPNSVSHFFQAPESEIHSRKSSRSYNHFTMHTSTAREVKDVKDVPFILPSRLSVAPASKDQLPSQRYSSLVGKSKPPSNPPPPVPDSPTKQSQVTTTVQSPSSSASFPTPTGKNHKHKWVFPKRTVPSVKARGMTAVENAYASHGAHAHPHAYGHSRTSTITAPPTANHGHALDHPPSASAITLNAIVQKLTPAATVPSSVSIEKFLNSYFQTTTPSTLIRKLIQRYNVPRTVAPTLSDIEFHVKVERPVRLRVCKLLKSVLEDVHLEWSPQLVSLVKVFIYGFIDKHSDLTRMLSKSLLKRFPGGRPILHFSRPILYRVLRNLELPDLCKAAQVCKMWSDTVSQPSIWKELYTYYESQTISDSKEVPLWEALSQSPTFVTDYTNSSQEILSIPKSPPSSPPLNRSDQPVVRHPTRYSSDFPAISIISAPEPSEPSDSDDSHPSPTHSSLAPIDEASEDAGNTLTTSFSALSVAGSASAPNTPGAARAAKGTRRVMHQRVGSDTSTNMKKISLNHLVESLTPVSTLPDLMDINAFLMTYRTFTTTQNLVRKLLQRYLVPKELFPFMSESDFKVSIEQPIQLRVCKILKQLIDSHWSDLDPLTITFIKVFVRGIVDQRSPLGSALLRSVTKQGNKTPSFYVGTKEKASKKFALGRRLSEMPGSKLKGSDPKSISDIMHFDPLEIAQQLCLIEYEIFKVLKPSEFFQQAWAKAGAENKAPNIRASIARFNVVTRWIVTLVVQQEKLSKRVKVLQKLIQIAKHLRDLNNFHTLMAFMAGINDGPIFRLKFTRAAIPESKMKLLEELQSLMNADSNYENYRQLLAMIPSTQPCIPYLGVCLRDLTYYEEGDAGGAEVGLINFKQSKNVYSVLHYISVHQKIAYPFEPAPWKDMLRDLPIIEDDDETHRLSLQREPRNSKRSDIL